MKQILAFVAASLLLAAPVAASDWPALVPGFTGQVPRVELQRGEDAGICSAVIFQIDPNGIAHALTAAHCVAHDPEEQFDVTLETRNARVEQTNRLLDLAIVQFKAGGKARVMALAPASPQTGAEVAVAGYAFGAEDLVVQFGRVAQTFNRETKALWVNGDVIFGDSGGAIVDDQGRLAGLTSGVFAKGPAHIGIAIPIEAIVDFIDSYREAVKERKQ